MGQSNVGGPEPGGNEENGIEERGKEGDGREKEEWPFFYTDILEFIQANNGFTGKWCHQVRTSQFPIILATS